MPKRCTVTFDGACRGNPGYGGAGAVIYNSNGNVVARVSKYLGWTTNNIAEYEGLIAGLERAIDMGYTYVHAMGDSQLVCNQVNRNWNVRNPNLLELLSRVDELVDYLNEFEISHIPRVENSDADAEAKRAACS